MDTNSFTMAMTEIGISEFIANPKQYVNTCSYFDSSSPESIIKYMFLVISITKKYIYYYILQNIPCTFEFPKPVAIFI